MRSVKYPNVSDEELTRCREGQVVVVEIAGRRTQTRQVSKMVT